MLPTKIKKVRKPKKMKGNKREVENSNYLANQIELRHVKGQGKKLGKYGPRGMSQDEYLFNKRLLLDIHEKKKVFKNSINYSQY
mmetsp:Transcript_28296/g.25008  ORF Transcript_28296/g.25008 Transcript_28296/m.25008 type:complete len:84 (+) Transcript_28296:453-704(+)